MFPYFIRSSAFLFLFFCVSSFHTRPVASEEITWLTWEEAIALNKVEKKKILVDLYTDWCGWCKKMDKTTFKDRAVVKYVSENFYAVKLNAEQKTTINYKNHKFTFKTAGRRGYHELAYSLLEGRLSYPSFVFLDENEQRITISPGFKDAKAMLKQLVFVGGEHYKTKNFNEFFSEFKSN